MAKKPKTEINYKMVPLKQIREPKYIARDVIGREGLESLMSSIEKNGLIQAIRLKPVKGGYEIVAGHRRFLAHKKLKLTEIKAEIVEATELKQEVAKLHENKIREDLTDIEEARTFEHMKKISKKTNAQIARELQVSEGYVAQKLAVLKYPDFLFNAMANQQITFSAARELIRITDKKVLEDYVDHAVRSGITPKVAKQWADDWLAMQKLNRDEVEEAIKETPGSTIDTIKLPCFIDGHYFKPENTVMIRVCRQHLEDIKEAFKMLKEGEAPTN